LENEKAETNTQVENWLKLKQALIMENSTGKRGRFFKYSETNAREFAQLTETLKQKVQAIE